MKAGYTEEGGYIPSRIGVPQGWTLSPLLSNIYLHEFDIYMEKKIVQLTTKGRLISRTNPKIPGYSEKISRLSDKYNKYKDPEILSELREIQRERNKIPSRIRTGQRIYYVRYADD